MKKMIAFMLSMLFLSSVYVHAQIVDAAVKSEADASKSSFNIFTVDFLDDENGSALISLSDIYTLSDDIDAIPNKTANGFEAQQYTLNGIYRKRFLSQTGVLETDTVFIYDYENNLLVLLAVRDLNIIARLNIYSIGDKGPFSQYDYMIGFEVDADVLSAEFSGNIFVHVGADNPFAQEQLTPLVWRQVASDAFPETSKVQDEKIFSDDLAYMMDMPKGNAYLAQTNAYQYFLQDYMEDDHREYVMGRRLMVVDLQTQEIIIDKIYYESESTSVAPLNGDGRFEAGEVFQWGGKLFKNKPPVVFGFVWATFGCTAITVIDPSMERIPIYCDNRH